MADLGRDYSWLSRSFDAFVRWTERVHGWRLYDNLTYWLTELPRFAEAIRCKLWGYGVEFDPGTFTIFSFVDCTKKLINRVGAGPERDGVGAPRADPAMTSPSSRSPAGKFTLEKCGDESSTRKY